ncbi:MAG: extracellular solute-binding protein, partial [Ignavibacteriae bacterium]|nr:extracellular solute-binding protein [Ignavibacteriota bacterium]
MIRILKHIVMGVLLLLSLVSCSKHNPTGTRQTIKFWHFWSEPRQKAVLQEQIAEFERLNPTIHVEMTDLQWSDGKTKLMLGFNAHTAPDVVHLGFEWMPEFISSGVLSPLSDSLVHDTAEYFPPALQSLVDHQKLYALPWTMNTRAMLISKKAVPN